MGDLLSQMSSWYLAAIAALVLVLGGLVAWAFWPGTGTATSEEDRQRRQAREWGSLRDRDIKSHVIDDRAVFDRLTLGTIGAKTIAAAKRASVALFAPTMSGKTTSFLIPRVLEWQGAVVATSAKADLVRLTLAHRSAQGPVWVFDPLGYLAQSGIATCRWSPLMRIHTYSDALVAASWIASTSAAGQSGSSNQKFWDDNAKRMLAPLLFAAAQPPVWDAGTGQWSHERHIGQVGRWLQMGQTADAQIEHVLRATGDRNAYDALAGLKSMHDQTRKNIATTAQIVLDPFTHARTHQALDPSGDVGLDFDPHRLLDEGGTLYVFAPEHEGHEFKTLFETIINTVVFAAQDRSAHAGGVPIGPHHLLLALDEAANMAPLRTLPELASVGSSQGIVLLSVWQNMSQPEAIYGPTGARTLMAGHNAKVFWGGIHDGPTLDYVQDMCGQFQAKKVTRNRDRDGRTSSSTSAETRPLAPPDFTRQLPHDTVLVLLRNSKPLRLQLRPWFDDAHTRALIDPAVAAEFDAALGDPTRRRPSRRPQSVGGRRG